jgi:hypothetical protein
MSKLARLAAWTVSFSISVTALAQAEPPPRYFVDESRLAFTALPGATAYFGVHTNAGYRIEVPDNWNGDLERLPINLHRIRRLQSSSHTQSV